MAENRDADLLARWRQGDQQAAAELFDRYAERLIGLARSRISAPFGQRFDPEDVVQSACRSFFVGAREGRYEVQHGNDLWQLLVVITLQKLRQQVRRNKAAKRAVKREYNFEAGAIDTHGLEPELLAREPSPMEAVALIDEVEQALRHLEPQERSVLELRLRGYNLDEIADATQRSERTVRRILERVKEQLGQGRTTNEQRP